MKKYLLVPLLIFVVLVWCAKKNAHIVDVNSINDLLALQSAISQMSQDIAQGNITLEEAQSLTDKFQQRYLELTDTTQQDIEAQFDAIQVSLKTIPSYTLPLRAKKLGMTEPKGMELNKILSKSTYTNNEWYSSTILVYKGEYTLALQQAEIIAQKAKLYISKTFEQAQSLAQVGNLKYISGLDISWLAKWIVYVNHDLLDTNIDNLLSVSVDQDGTLIIEATKYK